jgi:hypothetical protein
MPADGHLLITVGPHVNAPPENQVWAWDPVEHLPLVAGPLRLLEGDFPDREPMLSIVEHNIEETLGFVRPPR